MVAVDTFYVGHIFYCSNIEVLKVPDFFWNTKPASYSTTINPENTGTISRTLVECSHLFILSIASFVFDLCIHSESLICLHLVKMMMQISDVINLFSI